MQKVGILIFILIVSALTSLNTEILFSNAIEDNGFNSVAPNYDYRATGFNPQTQINIENVNHLELKWVHAWPLPESIDGIEPRIGSIANPIIVDGIVYNRMEDLRISAIDAKTRCRFDRRPVAGDLDRAKDHIEKSARDGRHGDRDIRLSPPALCPNRHTALLRLRRSCSAANGAADCG